MFCGKALRRPFLLLPDNTSFFVIACIYILLCNLPLAKCKCVIGKLGSASNRKSTGCLQ